MKLVFIAIPLVFLLGCSFSKNDTQKTPVVISAEKKDQLTEAQRSILSAIRRGDNAALKTCIKNSKQSDLVFSDTGITPMSEALKVNNSEAVKILVRENIDPFNLGEQTSRFQKILFQNGMKVAFEALQHKREAARISIGMTESDTILAQEIQQYMVSVIALINEGKYESANAIVTQSRLHSQIVESQLILSFQRDSHINDKQIIKYIKEFLGESKLKPREVQDLYEMELIRQFQLMFDNPVALSYLSNHRKLISLLWNIDNSGIWVSPSLLFRIAWSTENSFVNPQFCELASKQECDCQDHSDNRFEVSDLFLKRFNIPRSKFELMHMENGAIEGSYRYFPRQLQTLSYSPDNDVFFGRVSRYIKSNDIEDGAEKGEGSWLLGLQGKRRDTLPRGGSSPIVELPNPNDFCPARWGATLLDLPKTSEKPEEEVDLPLPFPVSPDAEPSIAPDI